MGCEIPAKAPSSGGHGHTLLHVDIATDAPFRRIPARTIIGALALLAGLEAVLALLVLNRRVITWIILAAFLAVLLSTPVEFVQRRLHFRRGLAIAAVFVVTFAILSGLLYTFIAPIASQSTKFVDDFPQFIQNAKDGKGAVGDVVVRLHLQRQLSDSEEQIRSFVRIAQSQALGVAAAVGNTVAAILTIIVLTFLMLLEGPRIVVGVYGVIGPERERRVRPVARDCTRAVSGYMAGNLLISVAAGLATFIFLTIAHVPFAGVLALWVAVADLIPLVGATLGAIPTVGIAFIAGPPQGIATLVFYVLYQQVENQFLQPTIMSRTVNLSPLTVLVSVLLGVQTFGMIGALLAIPVGAMIQVIVRDYWNNRTDRLTAEPEVGHDQTPIAPAIDSALKANK